MKQHQPSHPHGLLCLPQLFNMIPINKNAWKETYLSGRYPKPEIIATSKETIDIFMESLSSQGENHAVTSCNPLRVF